MGVNCHGSQLSPGIKCVTIFRASYYLQSGNDDDNDDDADDDGDDDNDDDADDDNDVLVFF